MSDSEFTGLPAIAAYAQLAAIVDSSDDAIVGKTLDGIVSSWNHGAERIFGYTAAEIIGKPITLLVPPDRLDEEPAILARIRAGERVDPFETVRRRKNGELVDVSVAISPIRAEGGTIVGASKIARDITGQKRTERELHAAKASAEAASQAKDYFLSVLSHELRTPLTPVLGVLGFLESHAELTHDELRSQIGMIRRNVETEARLVDDLLDLTRITRGKIQLHFEAIDAHAAIRAALATLQGEFDAKSLALTVALRAKKHHVWADPARLQQVILNLLGNAAKFTPADGEITLRSANREDGTFNLEITDTGVGIAPEVLPRLFNPFEQGEQTITRRFGGLGLGLSIVKSLVEMHGGSIEATSPGVDEGATFKLCLTSVAAPPRSQVPAAGTTQGLAGCRVLLVEDHEDTRLVMTRLLVSFGCIVTSTSTVKDALAESDSREFDLLLSDIGLPDGSGTDVMRHLHARKVKGIAFSGFGQDDDLRRSREAGFETHLIKPVNFELLKSEVRRIVGSRAA